MSGFERLFWYIAVPASVVFVIQSVMTLFGMAFDHTDTEVHDGGALDHAYFPVFTIRNLVVFLMMFGWTGIAMIRQFGARGVLVVSVATMAGVVLMLLVAAMFYGVARLTTSGNVVVDASIVGAEATVYLRIPAAHGGPGKVTVVFQGGQRELTAVTAGPELPTGAVVKICELKQDGSVVVGQRPAG